MICSQTFHFLGLFLQSLFSMFFKMASYEEFGLSFESESLVIKENQNHITSHLFSLLLTFWEATVLNKKCTCDPKSWHRLAPARGEIAHLSGLFLFNQLMHHFLMHTGSHAVPQKLLLVQLLGSHGNGVCDSAEQTAEVL